MAPGGPEAITVVLADDHTVMRNGLRLLLNAEPDFRVVAEAGNVETTFRQVRGHRPAVLVLDLNTPGGSSIAAIPRLMRLSPHTSIVVLTMEEDPLLVSDALSAGAHGYVRKHEAGTRLVGGDQVCGAGMITGSEPSSPPLVGRVGLAPRSSSASRS